ncbi:MAG: hypothetical protein LBU62_03955 [Bacteroidales bacterium]|jgi:hypothetical protein|nr:hypothetical protein [Bacteroidales bacterium]
MKKVWILQFGFAALTAAMLVCTTSCDPKDDDDSATTIIKATVENGASYNALVDEIKGVVWKGAEEKIVASGKYANSEFTLTLPATYPSEYLYTPEYLTTGITVNPATLKIGRIAFVGLKNGEPLPYLIDYSKETADLYVYASFLYATADATIKGTEYAITWNVSLKKGWNTIYTYIEDAGKKMTHNNQDPGGLMWKFEDLSESDPLFTITAQVEDGASYKDKVDFVKGLLPLPTDIESLIDFVSGEYTNGGFTLDLPVPAAENLTLLAEMMDDGITVSPATANFTELEIHGYKDGKKVAEFEYVKYIDEDADISAGFMYVDTDVTLIGSSTYSNEIRKWNVTLQKGWNPVYSIYTRSYSEETKTYTYTYDWTTREQSGLKWEIDYREDDEKSHSSARTRASIFLKHQQQ